MANPVSDLKKQGTYREGSIRTKLSPIPTCHHSLSRVPRSEVCANLTGFVCANCLDSVRARQGVRKFSAGVLLAAVDANSVCVLLLCYRCAFRGFRCSS